MSNSVDLSGIWGQTTASTETNAPAPPSAVDLSSIWGAQKSSPVAPTSTPGAADLSSIWGGGSARPDNGQPAQPIQHVYQDPNQSWYKRAWDFAQTPITESLFGMPEEREGAGGLERGIEHIASGFTSPLSLALTAATFGTGSLIESAGATALKEAGLSTAEIADAVKGSQAALGALKEAKSVDPVIQQALEAGGHDLGLLDRARKLVSPLNRDAEFGSSAIQNALKESGKFSPEELEALGKAGDAVAEAKAGFHPVEDAVRETGADVDVWKRAQKALYDNGLTEQDLLSKNMLENGAFQVLRHTIPDLPVAATARMAKTANAVLNAGFTLQQFETAAAMSPRFLDALKEGDTDKAWEYGTEAFAGGALGILGTPHALHAAGELFKPLLETDKFRPNDEFLAMDRANKEREVQHAVGEQESINLDSRVRKILGHETPGFKDKVFGPNADVKSQKELELASVFHQVVTGGDAEKAAVWHDALAEALGKDERLTKSPDNGQYGPANEADEWDQLENEVHSRTGKDPADVSYAELQKAGVSPELLNNWDKYTKRNPFSADTPELSKYARTQTLSGIGTANPVLLLNDYAHELLTRVCMNTRNWYGAEFNTEDVGKLVSALREEAQKGDRGNLSVLANELEKAASGGRSVVAVKKIGGLAQTSTIAHEQTHVWQTKYPLTPEQLKPVLGDPLYRDALNDLYRKGYKSDTDTLPDEILSHLSTDDRLGLSKTEAKDLTKKFLSLYPKEAISEFPNRNETTLNALKELGYDENINQTANRGILYQTSRVFGNGAGSPHPYLPDNIRELIADNNFKALPDSYKATVLASLKRVANGELSDRELEAAKALRDEQARNFQIGSSNDLLHSFVQDYMTRTYKDLNPDGKVVASEAKQGKFATNVTMARQRVYDSHLTALLKSPKPIDFDPVSVTAKGRGELIKAAANKQLIDTLRDQFTRGSDGRPAVVLSGQGQVVSGQNGEDPKTFIDPNRVRKINIADSVVQQLDKSGDLQRFLDEGTIKDLTPYVHPSNIQAAIEKLEEQSTRKEAQYDEVGNNKLSTDIMYLKSMAANKDYSGLKEFNDAQKKVYAWDPQDYISLNNNAMKGWNFVTNDSAGHNILVRSDIRVHPEFAEYLKNRLGLEPSAVASSAVGKALLGAGTKMKETLLSLSPFHMVQEALRGIMIGINPFHKIGPDILTGAKVDPLDPNSPTKINVGVRNGLTVGTDYKSLQDHSEGVAAGGGILRLIPGVGKPLSNAMDWYQSFLFKRYIPALKARGYELMFDRYQEAHPDWEIDHVAKVAATHANNTFGGINWKAMGRSATNQDWGRLLLLAPDWLEAEMRSGANLFNKDEGGLGRAQVAKMALGLWGVARVLNYASTGSFHNEAPFGLAVKNKEGKETVFGIRTLPTDLLHAASDPVGFLKGRLAPTIRTGEELLSQRDQFGRKLAPEDLWADVFRNMAPIPAQTIGQMVSGSGPSVGNPGQVWKSIGGTAQTYQTPAQKLAAELASNHNEDGPVDSSQMARHSRVMQLEDQVRSGDLSWPDLMKLTYETDQLKESELKHIQQNLQKTKGLDSSMASLYTRASRLPAKEYLQLLDVTNPSEKTALVPLTIQVQRRYLTKAKKDETPEERQRDPVFQRLLRTIPGREEAAPQPQSQAAPPPVVSPAIQKEVAYLYTATHPNTGHRVGSNDGHTWFDHQTGEPING
jgi:hypothetical protein